MAIIKNKLYKDYTMIPNWVITEKRVSNNAFRLLIYLYSKPDDWNVRQANIAHDLNAGKSTIKNWLDELKELEIVEVKRVGRGYEYHLKADEFDSQDVGSQDVGSQDVGSQVLGPLNKTNTTKTKYTNTDITNIHVGQTDACINDFKILCDFIESKLDFYKIKRDKRIEKTLKKSTVKELKENKYTFEDIELMMAYFKVNWANPKMNKYYRVSTLFSTDLPKRIHEAKNQDLDLRVVNATKAEEELMTW